MFRGANYRMQLCGNKQLGWFFLPLYAAKLGKEKFMEDLTEILAAMSADNQSPFTLYELESNVTFTLWKPTNEEKSIRRHWDGSISH